MIRLRIFLIRSIYTWSCTLCPAKYTVGPCLQHFKSVHFIVFLRFVSRPCHSETSQFEMIIVYIGACYLLVWWLKIIQLKTACQLKTETNAFHAYSNSYPVSQIVLTETNVIHTWLCNTTRTNMSFHTNHLISARKCGKLSIWPSCGCIYTVFGKTGCCLYVHWYPQ